MSRNLNYHALALRVRPFGESNREAWFLTEEEGIVKAAVFGGPKSRLRSAVAPFNGGTLLVYRDPVKNSSKVSEFDVDSWRPGLRELWERSAAANALAETVLAFEGGGGNWGAAARLSASVLDALSGASAALCPPLAVYFWWQWARIMGIGPDLSSCASCGRELKREEYAVYSVKNEALFCGNCAEDLNFEDPGRSFQLCPGARLWLRKIEDLPPEALERVGSDAVSFAQAKSLSLAVLAAGLGKRLPTWDAV